MTEDTTTEADANSDAGSGLSDDEYDHKRRDERSDRPEAEDEKSGSKGRPNVEIECRRPSMSRSGRVSCNLRNAVADGRRLSISVSELVLSQHELSHSTKSADSKGWSDSETSEPATPSSPEASDRGREYPLLNVFGEAPECTVFFFDWDDTLLPTSAAVVGGWAGKPNPKQIPMLTTHATIVKELLHVARSVGHVAIVTLAKRNWVQFTGANYLPGVDWEKEFKELDMPIMYAREALGGPLRQQAQKEEGVDHYVRSKTLAMAKCLRKFRRISGNKTFNLISIGDSPIEAEAAREVAWSTDGDNPCKTILLREESSTVEALTEQLRHLLVWIKSMAYLTEDFDMTLEEAKEESSPLFKRGNSNFYLSDAGSRNTSVAPSAVPTPRK